MRKLTEKEFIEEYCNNRGSQRCEGIGTEWFDGCSHKESLLVHTQNSTKG